MTRPAAALLIPLLLLTMLACGHGGDWGWRANTSAYEEEALRRLMKTIAAAKDARNTRGLSKRERRELEEAIAGAERAARELVKQRTKGGARIKTMQMLGMAATVIVANDVTAVGLADDPGLLLIGVAVMATAVVTSAPATRDELAGAMRELGRTLERLERALEPAAVRVAQTTITATPMSQHRPDPMLPPVTREDLARRRRNECKPVPSCPHRGLPPEDIHNICADRIPPNRFRGCDVLVHGKHFDAIGESDDILWEVKTERWSEQEKEFLQPTTLRRHVQEILHERNIAQSCGYPFIVAVADKDLYEELKRRLPDVSRIYVPQCLQPKKKK